MNTEHIEEASVELLPSNRETAVTKLSGFNSAEEMRDYCQKLIDGKLIPTSLKTPEAVMTVVMMGKELGFEPMASISNITPISGKPTLGIHAIGALLRKAGIAWSTIEDFVPVMGPEINKDTKQPTGNEVQVDRRTTIRFRRKWQGETITEDASFSWRDAERMELSTKDNWKKQPSVMCWSRAMAKGARRVAPDALLGMYETGEWADVSGKNYTVDAEGEVTVLN